MADLLSLLNFYPGFKKKLRVWEFEYDKVLFFGSRNHSGKLLFTNTHDPNDQVNSKYIFIFN